VGAVRSPVADSWQRSLDAGVDPSGGRLAAVVADRVEASAHWNAHPLATAAPLIRDCLASIAGESNHLIVVSDAAGTLLALEGNARVRSLAAVTTPATSSPRVGTSSPSTSGSNPSAGSGVSGTGARTQAGHGRGGKGSLGAVTHTSQSRAGAETRRQARARVQQDYRLRTLVARNLGCVTRLSPGQSQLLGLRAGLTGEAPQSASAVARILHVTAGREARLEHDALTALSQTGRYGCPATPTTTVVFDTGFPLLITPNGPFGAASAPGPNHTVASAGAARAPRPTRAVEGPRSGSLGVTRARHSAAYYGAGVDGPAVSPTSGSPGTNVLLNRLLLAAAALAAVVMVAWYAESRAYPLSTSPGRPRPSARALPGPHPWQPVRSRKGIRILPFIADGAGRRLRGLGAALLALRAHRRRAEPRRQAELPQAVSNGNAHAQKAVAELPPPPDRIVSGMESEDTELGL
jgi:hypothetical protein